MDNFEHGLDYPPMLDPNPWRLSLRAPADAELFVVPFGLLFGLAVAGLVVCGVQGSGGRELWLTLGAAALTPLLFYVSSRYRLPVSALLPVPAAAGLVALTSAGLARRARVLGWTVALVAALTSFLVPSGPLRTSERAAALSNLAFSYLNAGQLEPAERRARQALELAPRVASPRLALAKILEARGNVSEALEAYRMTLFVDPGQSEAAGSAARLLIGQGRPAEAVPLLRGALAVRPGDARGWHILVLAHVANGDPPAARAAFDEARRHGITLDPELLAAGATDDTTTEEP